MKWDPASSFRDGDCMFKAATNDPNKAVTPDDGGDAKDERN